MILTRYIVEVDQTQSLKLLAEHIELATQIDNGLTKLLIFRDRFVACKVATRSGGVFRKGRVIDNVGKADNVAPGSFTLGGCTLVLEPEIAEA